MVGSDAGDPPPTSGSTPPSPPTGLRREAIQGALIIGLLGLVGTVAAAFIGNAGGLTSVLPGSPVVTSFVQLPPVIVTTTVVQAPAGGVQSTGASARSIQWGPGEVTVNDCCSGVDFDATPPNNSAPGGSRDVLDAGLSPVDGMLQTGEGAKLAVWGGAGPPSVNDCLTIDDTQSAGRVRVVDGSVICIHTDEDRLVIASISKITAVTNGEHTYQLEATVYGPA